MHACRLLGDSILMHRYLSLHQMLVDHVNDQKEVAASGESVKLAAELMGYQGTQLMMLEPGIYWGAYSPVLAALQVTCSFDDSLSIQRGSTRSSTDANRMTIT